MRLAVALAVVATAVIVWRSRHRGEVWHVAPEPVSPAEGP